ACAAPPRSRAEKAMLRIASTSGTTLCSFMSMCSTASTRRSDFFGFMLKGSASFQLAIKTNTSQRLALLFWIQPLHVIFNAGLERKLRLITECAPSFVQVRLGEILVVGMRIVDVV